MSVRSLDHDNVSRDLLVEHQLPPVETQQPAVVLQVLADDLDGAVDVLLEQFVGRDQVVLVVLLQQFGVRVGEALEVDRGGVDPAGDVLELDLPVLGDVQPADLAHHGIPAVVHCQCDAFFFLAHCGHRRREHQGRRHLDCHVLSHRNTPFIL
jgi:hypothetical protein